MNPATNARTVWPEARSLDDGTVRNEIASCTTQNIAYDIARTTTSLSMPAAIDVTLNKPKTASPPTKVCTA